jgi:hypothetical protein
MTPSQLHPSQSGINRGKTRTTGTMARSTSGSIRPGSARVVAVVTGSQSTDRFALPVH